jgi:hypothetical protein
MRDTSCVGCALPVLELDGQFEKLDSYFIENGSPPVETAGWWHTSCLRASAAGAAWQTAQLRNFSTVRGFTETARTDGWIVLAGPRGDRIAVGASGELLDLARGSKKRARAVAGGLVYPKIEEKFYLHLADEEIIAKLKEGLLATFSYPVTQALEVMRIADKVADPVALEEAVFRWWSFEFEGLWTQHSVVFRAEYGVFVPDALVPFLVPRPIGG